MFKNLFKKEEPKQRETKEKKAEKARPVTLPETNLDTLYRNSVQKTPKDFVVERTTEAGQSETVAMDSACGSATMKALEDSFRPNFIGQEVIFTHFANEYFIGYNNCAILSQNWLINKACCAAVEDAASIEYDVTLKDETTSKDDTAIIDALQDITLYNSDFDIKKVCKEFGSKKRQFGQILCVPVVDDVDYTQPFNIDAITSNSYKGMRIIEPMWYRPILDLDGTTNPLDKRFYKPTYFGLPNGDIVHYTWCIWGTYGEVPDLLKATYYWGGYPLPQLIYNRVYAAEKTANEAPMLAMSKRLNYVEGNLNAYIVDQQRLNNELRIISWLRNNWGWLLVKKDQRIGQLDTSLTDFDAVTMLQYQLVASVSGVPAARLLETSPKGWQSTGSYEDNNYKKLQLSIQNLDFIPILNLHYKLLAKSKYDKDYDFSCTFCEIDVPTEKERAEINEINSRTDLNYMQAGVISPDEVRTALREDVNSGYNTLPEEIEEENENPFGNIFGGGENSQSPFKSGSRSEVDGNVEFSSTQLNDGDVRVSFRNSTGAVDEWQESEHPRKANGQFGSGGENGKVEKSSRRDKIKSRERKEVQLPKEEYAQVMHELNTNLPDELRKKKNFTRAIGNNIYTIINNKFDNYKIIGKSKIDDIFD